MPATTEIPFTEFCLPNGRQKSVTITIKDNDGEYAAKVTRIIRAGCKFEIETLTTGAISATIEDHANENTLASSLVFDVSNLKSAICSMIDVADKQICSNRS